MQITCMLYSRWTVVFSEDLASWLPVSALYPIITLCACLCVFYRDSTLQRLLCFCLLHSTTVDNTDISRTAWLGRISASIMFWTKAQSAIARRQRLRVLPSGLLVIVWLLLLTSVLRLLHCYFTTKHTLSFVIFKYKRQSAATRAISTAQCCQYSLWLLVDCLPLFIDVGVPKVLSMMKMVYTCAFYGLSTRSWRET